MSSQDLAYAGQEGLRIEFGSNDVVGAIIQDSHSPIADKSDELARTFGPDLRAQRFGVVYGGLALDIDQNKIVAAIAEYLPRLFEVIRGIDMVSGETKDLIAQRAQNLSLATVKDAGIRTRTDLWCGGSTHGKPCSLVRKPFGEQTCVTVARNTIL